MEPFSHPLLDIKKGCFNSASGRVIDIMNPRPDMIDIEDIANALSNMCRFGGHTKGFYSVAQHSVIVSRMVPQPQRLEALLHDATEAFVQDIISPLKHILGETYKPIEAKWEAAIASEYGITLPLHELVKDADIQALQLEFDCLLLGKRDEWDLKMKELGLPVTQWTPGWAKDKFLYEFRQYKK